jgi:hypothetical protein
MARCRRRGWCGWRGLRRRPGRNKAGSPRPELVFRNAKSCGDFLRRLAGKASISNQLKLPFGWFERHRFRIPFGCARYRSQRCASHASRQASKPRRHQWMMPIYRCRRETSAPDVHICPAGRRSFAKIRNAGIRILRFRLPRTMTSRAGTPEHGEIHSIPARLSRKRLCWRESLSLLDR